MADDEQLRECFHGVLNCEETPHALRRVLLCPKHCMEAVCDDTPPAGHDMWSEDLAMLEVRNRGMGNPILATGQPVNDWAARSDAADFEAAVAVAGDVLFARADIVASPVEPKHPAAKEEGDGRDRLFANGYILAMLSAVVSFVKVHKRKPKGQEFHPWVNFAWRRYVRGEDGSAAAAAAAAEGADAPADDSSGQRQGRDAEAPAAAADSVVFWGDGISAAKTNIKPLADWQASTNLGWITTAAKKTAGVCVHSLSQP